MRVSVAAVDAAKFYSRAACVYSCLRSCVYLTAELHIAYIESEVTGPMSY